MKTLKDLYQNHTGKVSDKWTIYLDVYEEKLNQCDSLKWHGPKRIPGRKPASDRWKTMFGVIAVPASIFVRTTAPTYSLSSALFFSWLMTKALWIISSGQACHLKLLPETVVPALKSLFTVRTNKDAVSSISCGSGTST